MKFDFDFRYISFSLRQYEKELMKQLRTDNRIAGQKWLMEVTKGTPIPTWSGASRGTFQKLASALGTSVPIGFVRGPADLSHRGNALSEGEVIEDKKEAYVGFRYSTSLLHLHYNEYNRAVAGKYPRPYSNNVRFTPYKFQGRAERVRREYAKKVKLPDPYRFIHTGKL